MSAATFQHLPRRVFHYPGDFCTIEGRRNEIKGATVEHVKIQRDVHQSGRYDDADGREVFPASVSKSAHVPSGNTISVKSK